MCYTICPPMKQIISAILFIIGIVGIAVVSFTYQQVEQEKNSLILALQRRSAILADYAKEQLNPTIPSNANTLPKAVDQFVSKQRVTGIAVFSNKDSILASSSGIITYAKQLKQFASTSMDEDTTTGEFAECNSFA